MRKKAEGRMQNAEVKIEFVLLHSAFFLLPFSMPPAKG
jgi:hypothetical protein